MSVISRRNPSASLTIRDSAITDNHAVGIGGGILNGGRLDLIDSIVAGNSSEEGGGGIASGGYLRLLGSTSIGATENGNNTFSSGGGILLLASGYTFVCGTCTVTGNKAEGWWDDNPTPGGGIYVEGGRLVLEDPSRVFGNVPDQVRP